jgi:hypothetical protein
VTEQVEHPLARLGCQQRVRRPLARRGPGHRGQARGRPDRVPVIVREPRDEANRVVLPFRLLGDLDPVFQPGTEGHHDVVGRLRPGRYLLTDRAPFPLVGVQDLRVGEPVDDRGQLPPEVERVLHAPVHALPAGGRVDMGGVPAQQHPALTVTGGDVVEDLPLGGPLRLADLHADAHLVGDLLERLTRVAGRGHRARVAQVHPPVPTGEPGDQHEKVRGDEVVDPGAVVGESLDLHVHHGHHADALPGEADPGLLPHPALGPVAADDPVVAAVFHVAGVRACACVPEPHVDPVLAFGHGHELRAVLRYQRVLGVQVLAQDLLEVVLVELVVEGVPGGQGTEVGPRQLVRGHALEVVDVARAGQAHLLEPVRHADVLEHLHGPGVQGEGPGGVGGPRALLGEPDAHAPAQQLVREDQAGGAGADDENVAWLTVAHGELPCPGPGCPDGRCRVSGRAVPGCRAAGGQRPVGRDPAAWQDGCSPAR